MLLPIPVEMHLRILLLKEVEVEWADHSHKEGDVSTRGGPDKLPWKWYRMVVVSLYQDCKVVSDVLHEKNPLRHDIPSEVQ